MKKFIIPMILSLCIVLSSCNVFIISHTVDSDSTREPELTTSETEPTKPITPNKAELPSLSPSNGYKNYLSTLPDYDFAQKYFGAGNSDITAYFTVVTVADTPLFAGADEMFGNTASAAVTEIENKFNVEIARLSFTHSEFASKIALSESSKTYFADLLCLDVESAVKYANGDYCKKVSSLPFLNTENPYNNRDFFGYDTELSEYCVMNEASYKTSDLYCMYFDTGAVSDELYGAARSSGLDWELVKSEMLRTQRGIYTSSSLERIFRLTSGARYTQVDGKLAWVNSPFTPADEKQTAEDAFLSELKEIEALADKRSPAFIIDKIGNFENYTSSKTPYGILPLPGYGGSVPVGCVDPEDVTLFLCPNYTTTQEGAGLIISALGASFAQRGAELYLGIIRDYARDNGTLLVSHLLFAAPSWDISSRSGE